MYRVMLIDDEQSVRKLLRAMVDWNSLNMEVVGEAASGIEAINTIDELRPDIAFVDISMPFMNGIEFTKLASGLYPGLIVIILTAFDDFEYARKCIGLPIQEYMLKPIVRAEVHQVLEKVKDRLDSEQEKRVSDWAYDEEEEQIQPNAGALKDIEHIIEYINDNYSNPGINLASAARDFGLSARSLNSKFKAGTGCGFLEFLNNCRMQQAVKLAAEGLKMFMVSSKVGIPDPNYFGKCFKKYTGVNYSDYKVSE